MSDFDNWDVEPEYLAGKGKAREKMEEKSGKGSGKVTI